MKIKINARHIVLTKSDYSCFYLYGSIHMNRQWYNNKLPREKSSWTDIRWQI